jgi:hypothetical protein
MARAVGLKILQLSECRPLHLQAHYFCLKEVNAALKVLLPVHGDVRENVGYVQIHF